MSTPTCCAPCWPEASFGRCDCRPVWLAASVAESALGVPKVSPLLIRPLVAAGHHGFRGNSYQQLLYKEFMAAWRRS